MPCLVIGKPTGHVVGSLITGSKKLFTFQQEAWRGQKRLIVWSFPVIPEQTKNAFSAVSAALR
jgi:hypothetical protein